MEDIDVLDRILRADNPFEALGLPLVRADASTVTKAYRAAARHAHPVSPTLISGRGRSFGSGRGLSVGPQVQPLVVVPVWRPAGQLHSHAVSRALFPGFLKSLKEAAAQNGSDGYGSESR